MIIELYTKCTPNYDYKINRNCYLKIGDRFDFTIGKISVFSHIIDVIEEDLLYCKIEVFFSDDLIIKDYKDIFQKNKKFILGWGGTKRVYGEIIEIVAIKNT